jgi:hypothetical protein
MAINLVLGNSTEDTDVQCRGLAQNEPYHGLVSTWPIALESGWYHTDVGTLSLSDVHRLCQQVDNIYLVHSSPDDYPDYGAYSTTLKVYEYYSRKVDHNNQQLHIVGHSRFNGGVYWPALADAIGLTCGSELHEQEFFNLPRLIKHQDFYATNIIVHFGTIDGVDPVAIFQTAIDDIVKYLRAQRCRFLLVRTGIHESYSEAIANILIQYPEFVFLHPDCFEPSGKELVRQLYWRWQQLYN